MAYTIELAQRAFDDIDAIVERIQADSPQNATRWRRKLFNKIDSIETFPHGCALAPENDHCPFEVRQTMLGNYRVLFTINDERSHVLVLTVRHGARRFMGGDELSGIHDDPKA